jgi:hypothetical protein
MKNHKIFCHRDRLGRGLTAFAFLAAIMCFASVAGAVYNLPANRAVTWKGNVGVSGDIPDRSVVYKTLSPSGGDDTSAIQTAINNCPSGQVVQLNKGTFNVTKIDMKSNVTLRGGGIGLTTLKGTSTTSNYIVSFSNGGGGLGTSYNLASGYSKGSTSITTSTNHGWQAGDIILIDELQNPTGDPPISNNGSQGTCTWCGRSSGTRPIGQVVKLTSVSGTSAVPEIPLYWSFSSGLSPQGTKINIGVQFAGVEDLTIDNSTSWNANQQNLGTVVFNGAANCWLLRVDVYGIWETGIMMKNVYRNTIRSSRVHHCYAYTTSEAYGLWMEGEASANLVEDSIFDDSSTGPIFNGATSGNVIAYNYVTNIHRADIPNAACTGISNHGAHPFMNLWEGNYVDGPYMASDHIWGTASHNTWFRNRVFYNPGYTSIREDMNIWTGQTYFNVVGNILGTVGSETVYQSPTVPYTGSPGCIYTLGCSGTYGLETTSLLRHGNWDSVNKAVVWDPTITDHTLPDSYYLSAKPGWWTNMPWPAIGPDLATMDGSIPARQRYLLSPPTPKTPVVK